MKRITIPILRKLSILLLVFCTCFALAADHHARPQWKNKIVTFDVPGAGTGASQGTFPEGISAGVIIGNYIDAEGANHGFVRAPDGKFTYFDVPGAGTGSGQGTIPMTNNAAGEITGAYFDDNGALHAFLRLAVP